VALDTVELAVSFAGTVLADLCRSGGCNVYLALSGQPANPPGAERADSAASNSSGRKLPPPLAPTTRNGRLLVEFLGGPASSVTLQGLMERLAVAEAQTDDALPATLTQVLRRIPAATEIVLVGTRPVDLADTSRFGDLWSDPVLRDRLRHIRQVDASSPELGQYFQAE
jgi:hypothetical protein